MLFQCNLAHKLNFHNCIYVACRIASQTTKQHIVAASTFHGRIFNSFTEEKAFPLRFLFPAGETRTRKIAARQIFRRRPLFVFTLYSHQADKMKICIFYFNGTGNNCSFAYIRYLKKFRWRRNKTIPLHYQATSIHTPFTPKAQAQPQRSSCRHESHNRMNRYKHELTAAIAFPRTTWQTFPSSNNT